MTDPLLGLFAGCVLSTATRSLSAVDGGTLETIEAVVEVRGECTQLDVLLPPGAHLREHSARVRLTDGTRRSLGDERWRIEPRGFEDEGLARLVIPELLDGDRVELRFARHWDRHLGAPAPVPPIPVGSPTGLSVDETLERLSGLVLVPRGVDGSMPLAGEPALQRGAVDDRGFALTAAMMLSGGGRRVEIGRIGDPNDPDSPWIAVVWDGDVGTALGPGSLVEPEPRLWAPSGAPTKWSSPVRHDPDTSAPVRTTRTRTLRIPEGDVQAALWPGAGSAVDDAEEITFPATAVARTWLVPVPPDARDLAYAISPAETGTTVRVREDAVVIVAAPSDDPTTVTLSWTSPDAPACGEVEHRPGERAELVVTDPDGRIRRSGPFWSLTSHAGQMVVPDRDSIVSGLQWRFNAASLPEPGLPADLRGLPPSEELLAALRPALHDRVHVAQLAGDPLWPRKLHKARRSGVVTPLEAALILRLYATQARMQSTWALVRSAERGPGDDVCPTVYDEAVTVVASDGQLRFIDPTCTVCAPFELRPHLEGASAFGPGIDRTPPPSPGSDRRAVSPGRIAIDLVGPPALLLRMWLADIPTDRRAAALAERFGAPGGELLEATGIGEAGAPIRLVVGSNTSIMTELSLPEIGADGYWFEWIGERRVERPVPTDPVEPVDIDLGAVRFRRFVEGDRLVESLDVRERAVNAEQVEALSGLRPSPG